MKKYASQLMLILMALFCISEAETRLLRNPDISGNKVVFVYANDLWLGATDDVNPKRLTTSDGMETDPHFSPDGNWIAFTGQYDGNTDAYILPVTGGEPQRLTWHPGNDAVRGWNVDGTAIIFASDRESAPASFSQFYQISKVGGFPKKLPLPRIYEGCYSPDGKKMAYQEIEPWESEFRNYRGGQNNPIRIVDMKSLDVEKVPFSGANDKNPIWVKNGVYFLSDEDFTTNIFFYDTKTGDRRQITFFKTFDCKQLEADSEQLIFENGGYIYILRPNDKEPVKLVFNVAGDFPWARVHWEKADGSIRNFHLSPAGKRAVFEARGEIFTVPAKKGDCRNLTGSSGAAERCPAWSPKGDQIAWFSDASGEYQLVIADQYGQNRKSYRLKDPTFYYTPVWSPDGRYIAFANENRDLLLFDIEKEKEKIIDSEGFANPVRVIYPEWSKDSKWIAYTRKLDNQYNTIFLYSLEKDKSYQMTDGMADCISPAWDASGKYIYFLSSTNYALNVGWLDMSSIQRPLARSIYAVVLSAEEPSPLLPESDDEEIIMEEKNKEKKDDEPKEEEQKVEDLKIDIEGLQNRIIALDIPAANYRNLQAGAEGKIYFMRETGPTSSLRPDNNQPPLICYDITEKEEKEVLDGVSDYCFSFDKSKILATRGYSSWAICDVGESINFSDGTIATSEMSMQLDPVQEWKQIFREAWRYQRDFFYVENVHGLDLQWAYDTYSQWLPHVRHRTDLNYILDILGGETSVGHSFTGGGDFPAVDRVPVGLLGADLVIEKGLYKIKKIYTSEAWNPDLKAPLNCPGIDVRIEDYILEVNHQKIQGNENFYRYFDKTSGRQVKLKVSSHPDGKEAREVVVVPVSDESDLRARTWIEENRKTVDRLSNGKLAYIWLPNTAFDGYNYFNRYYFAQMNKKGAIIDERYNQGGFIADYIVDLLSRELLGFFNNPVGDKKPFRAPNAAIFGPKVLVINESAGSGGDMLPYMFRKKQIGPLVGTKTWGGLVGIWDVPSLIDGGYITAPRGGFYNTDGEWDVENKGIAPDIEVEMTPKLVNMGHDPQLEKAVETALDLLKTDEVKILPQPADPVKVKRAQ